MIRFVFLTSLVIFVEDPELRQPTVEAARYLLDNGEIRSWCITEDKSKSNITVKYFPADIRAPRAFIRIDFTVEMNKYYKPTPSVLIHEFRHAIYLIGD